MKRLLTAAIGVPIFILVLFKASPVLWFFFTGFFFCWGAVEFVSVLRAWVPRTPLRALPAFALLMACWLAFASPDPSSYPGATASAFLVLVAGVLVLLGRVPSKETLPALGALAFGIPYFALPMASFYHLKVIDPWLIFLLAGMVWLGDTAAYYVGSAIGKHRLAPKVSPKKTWEGAVAGLVAALAYTAGWCYLRLGTVPLELLGLAAVTAVAAQMGDLVESMLKRGAGVKDSGNFLPGHGGWWDRADALLFAAPVFWLGLLIIGADLAVP